MAENKRIFLTEHPVACGSFTSWLRLLWKSGGIERKFLPRAFFVAFSTLLMSPLRAYERVRYGRTIKNTAIHPSPIFIIGHWRTGTTHLHNLMCKDRNIGYVTVFQAMAAGCSIVGERLMKPGAAKIAGKRHPTREIDNVPLSMDNPEEQDLAIASMSPYSYLHLYTFPRRARYFYETYVTFFDRLPQRIIDEWTEIYLTIMRKATLANGGKRLIIKNCADSARIPTLLKLFPDAKFIHIYRNPYHVFRSTLHLHKIILPTGQLQEIGPDETEANVLLFYAQLMQRFLADRALIPEGNLVEVRYEDLEEAPLDEIRRVYDTLGLPGFTEVEPAITAYVDSIAGYQKNPQAMGDNVINKVNEHWQFALDEFGYERLEPTGAQP
jgi:hypothetical protein